MALTSVCCSVQLLQKLGQAGVTIDDFASQYDAWLAAAVEIDHLPRGVRLE